MKPGPELDALIAEKVLGLEVCRCDHDALKLKAFRDWEERCKDPLEYHGTPRYFSHSSGGQCNTCGKHYVPYKGYSTDISAAWEVVEKFRDDDNFSIAMHGTHWKVHFGAAWDGAETAAHAICLAALRAIDQGQLAP